MSETRDDFAAMFEASNQAKRIERGQTIQGTVVGIGADVAFIDVGGKGEAQIDLSELRDEDGALEVAVGDRVDAVVVSTEGGLKLSRKLTRRAASARQLEEAFRARLPVEGKVERAVKGGYEVRLGQSRAFCPMSQIDARRSSTPVEHEGRVYTFLIIDFKEGGRNIVVSRRRLIEDEERARAIEIRKSIVVGAVLTGRVTSVRDFGAFVDLGAGVQGLLHVSEIGWSRVSDPSQVLKQDEEITVKVLRVDEDEQKISLGLKQLTADPWSTAGTTYEVGQVHTGRVTRVADFGAFVELEPGVEALAHASTFAPTGHSKGWSRAVSVGTTAQFEILSVDLEKRRIGVALVDEGARRRSEPPEASPQAGVAGVNADAREADEVREYNASNPPESQGLRSLANSLRNALKPRGDR